MAVRLTKFKIGLYVFFAVCAVGSIVALRYGGSGGDGDDENVKPSITVWGSIDGEAMGIMNDSAAVPVNLSYRQVNATNLYMSFLESAASGQIPDLIIMPYGDLGQFFSTGRTATIPYESYSERAFDDNFIAGTSFLKTSTGLKALPVFMDPLVMYYNRAILDNVGILYPVSKWAEAYTTSERLTQREGQLGIARSTFGMGEADNITHAKDILAALFLQLGLPIIDSNGTAALVGGSSNASLGNAGTSALRFYTSFADPAKNHYTWNRALPTDKEMFLAEDLIYYFGKVSERGELQRRNPNMSLDVALFPQASGNQQVTTGDLYVAVFPSGSRNITAAVSYIYWLTNPNTITTLIKERKYPFTPIVRAVLAAPQPDLFSPVAYQSAITARFWRDPNSVRTKEIFTEMISDVTSGRRSTDDSINRAMQLLGGIK